jgi:iron(III) transport system ATP-binding protein
MIEVTGLCKRFGKVTALVEISFSLSKGQPLVLLGPSGSGKTTLLRLLAGLEEPDAGEIRLGGQLASRPGWLMPPNRRGIGFVFQSPALWPHMTIAQNIGFGVRVRRREVIRTQVNRLLALTKLEALADRYPHQISGGEARRAALARALATEPSYLLMDEPLINLDWELKARMIVLFKDLLAEIGPALLYVTHDLAEAEQISANLLYLKEGRLTCLPPKPACESERIGL